MRVDEAIRMLAGPGTVGDELPWTLDETLAEAQLGRVLHWPAQDQAAVLIDDLWTREPGDPNSAILLVDGVTSLEVSSKATPFVGGTLHFAIGVAAARTARPGLEIEIGAMMHAGQVRIAGTRALLVTLTDRTRRDDAAPSLGEDRQGYIDWSLDLDREIDVLGWYEVRPDR